MYTYLAVAAVERMASVTFQIGPVRSFCIQSAAYAHSVAQSTEFPMTASDFHPVSEDLTL